MCHVGARCAVLVLQNVQSLGWKVQCWCKGAALELQSAGIAKCAMLVQVCNAVLESAMLVQGGAVLELQSVQC